MNKEREFWLNRYICPFYFKSIVFFVFLIAFNFCSIKHIGNKNDMF
jgi:hypothetical protein